MSIADKDQSSSESEPNGGGFLSHVPAILAQRRWFIIIPAVVVSAAGIAVAAMIPERYQATAVVLVESQQLAPELIGATGSNEIDRRIATLREQVLSRPDLVALIDKNNLYPALRKSGTDTLAVDAIRAATVITPVSAANVRDDRGSNTVAFQLSFDYSQPAEAKLVAQDFVGRLLNLDSAETATRAAGTVQFLQAEATGLNDQISQIEQQIENIKGSNGAALAGSTAALMVGGGGGYEGQVATLRRENAQLQAQLNLAANGSSLDPAVAAAEAQLANARALYSDSHPDVRLAEVRLAAAKRAASANASGRSTSSGIQDQINANNAMIGSLESARARDSARTSSILSAQSRAPLINEQISQLQAKADQFRSSYKTVSENLLNAKATMRMNEEKKGERLSIIDPPQVSSQPLSPSRDLLMIASVVAGLVMGFACALIVEMIRRPIRGVDGVERAVGVGPLIVIPTLPAVAGVRRRSFFARRAQAG